MKSAAFVSLLATASAAITPKPVNYDGYKVFRVPAVNEAAADTLRSIISNLGLSPWKMPMAAGAFSDIVVPPSQLKAFEPLVAAFNPEVMHEDLGKSIAAEGTYAPYAAGSANETWFKSYHSYADHQTWLKDIQAKYSSQSAIVSSGTSGQNRAINGLHFYGKGGKGKPAVVFHGTVHAREWISTMVQEYLIQYLLEGYSTDKDITAALDKYDFYIFPVVNPDGFVYTQQSDRNWRKNRGSNGGSNCVGTDVNRNWPFRWDGPGSSTDPCAETYRGPSAGSSPENKAYTSWLQGIKRSQGVKLYIDWHAYSQLFMSPYGYTCNAVPAKDSEYQSIMRGAVSAIRAVHGTSFKSGTICKVIYQAAGSSVDWTNDVLGADYSFAVELRDTGRYGFVLPADQIIPSGQETIAGVKYLLANMK